MNARKLLSAAKAVEPVFVEELFSTYLYTGNGSTQTITNGIDLAGKGGLVWIKSRPGITDHYLFDTARGVYKRISSNTTAAQGTSSFGLSAFNSNGFTLGDGDVAWNSSSASYSPYASWTFRKQAKFFDVVTYTGDGTSNRALSHALGATPGCVIFKCTSDAQDWKVYHRSVPSGQLLNLNLISGYTNANIDFGSSAYTSTDIYVGGNLNTSSRTYVAYIFAHNAGGFGLAGSDNVITCDSLTTNGSGVFSVNLGYEPQWVLLKKSASSTAGNSDWFLLDNMRGWSNTNQVYLYPNTSGAEYNQSGSYVVPTATGFQSIQTGVLDTSSTYIYIAIRRGPMKTPTTGTSVFAVKKQTTAQPMTLDVGFPSDTVISSGAYDLGAGKELYYRLTGNRRLETNTSNQESNDLGANYVKFDEQDKFSASRYVAGFNSIWWFFRRAPGFFDVVCDTGTGAAHTISHNLSVVPELIIRKRRDGSGNWGVCVPAVLGVGNTDYLYLNTADNEGVFGSLDYWNNTQPTTSVFSVGTAALVNSSGATYVTYLFATCPGVSKVFSYTGNGSSQTINCGFTGGARFVLIKRTDNTGNWTVFDSARGIVAGNDPALYLNSTAAEVTTIDAVDTENTGFIVNQDATLNLNVNAATYIGLAIA